MKQLVLQTLEYPYGKGETFLESEIPYLAQAFDQIAIIPSGLADSNLRTIPNNCTVYPNIAKLNPDYSFVKLVPYLKHLIPIYTFSLAVTKKRRNYIKYFKSLFHYFYNDIKKKEILLQLINRNHWENALFYDYWMLNNGITLSILLKKRKVKHMICRAHGFDLYNEVHMEGIVPFKEFKTKNFSKIYTISQHGETYLKREAFSAQIKNKISTRYLGVDTNNTFLPEKQKTKIVVSCSSMIELKQVDKIARVLGQVSKPIKWVHFGSGPTLDKVKKAIDQFPSHIETELFGLVPNAEIKEYYRKHYVEFFISLSRSEGIPVSMMEAQSFGIPVVAPSINGIPEIVNESTGVLLDRNYNLTQVIDVANKIIEGTITFDRLHIKECNNKKFNARVNFEKFAQEISTFV